MKFECIFASEPRQGFTTIDSERVDFLYPFGCVIDANILPSVSLYGLLFCYAKNSCTLAGLEEADGFFYTNTSNFIHTMPRYDEICEGAKQSTTSTRRGSAKTASCVSTPDADQSIADILTELTEAFNAEKDAKNKAYLFILSNGLLDHFADFCRNYHSCDPHKDCMEYLLSKF